MGAEILEVTGNGFLMFFKGGSRRGDRQGSENIDVYVDEIKDNTGNHYRYNDTDSDSIDDLPVKIFFQNLFLNELELSDAFWRLLAAQI